MQKVIITEQVPIKLWLTDIESGALEQAKHLANFPFAFHHIAIMPDAHEGYGMPIGGIVATKDVVIPNAVGVDIGCGMCAVRTTLQTIDRTLLKKVLGEIRNVIPVGFAHHPHAQPKDTMPKKDARLPVVSEQFQRALKQVGTLGGGNHFIEVQSGSDGYVWLMVHSGSRNLGKQVADHYNRIARQHASRYNSTIPKAWQLDYLPLNSDKGKKYWQEMNYCVEFALANRKWMIEKIRTVFEPITGAKLIMSELVNIAHNYAAKEKHFGQQVIVHRKGATQAKKGQLGIIPGSQGSKSYLVRGLGNPESFESCSHGAGRKIGRNEARKSLVLEREIQKLDRQGILHGIRGKRDLDEAPSAYKNIDEVMRNQQDLVEIITELSPLAVIKG